VERAFLFSLTRFGRPGYIRRAKAGANGAGS
jgi:hypothetical protein